MQSMLGYVRRNIRTRTLWRMVAAALLIVVVLAAGIVWYQWGWKTLIGWRALVEYIEPKSATQKKEALQVYAIIVAGVIASITAAVGLANLRLTRRNLEQQRELEAERAQGGALQAYYEQIGKLITEYDLLNTRRREIRELARGQTLTVLQEVDGKGKRSLLTFLYRAGLIGKTGEENPVVTLVGADLQGAALQEAHLQGANLQGVDLHGANLHSAFLQGANLQEAHLYDAFLQGAFLEGANLQEALLQDANLYVAFLTEADLQGAALARADLRLAGLLKANLQAALLYKADLQDAFLQGANLEGANLEGANLHGANLHGANLQGAKLLGAKFQAADLEGAIMPDGSEHP
jgi:uncharacterized protein YjbI with pentapeptide repeats